MQKKIDIQQLRKLLTLTNDKDTISYQENILEFLEKLKDETLKNKKTQIAEDEEILEAEAENTAK